MNNAPADPLSWYYDIPIVTRVYLTGAFMTTDYPQETAKKGLSRLYNSSTSNHTTAVKLCCGTRGDARFSCIGETRVQGSPAASKSIQAPAQSSSGLQHVSKAAHRSRSNKSCTLMMILVIVVNSSPKALCQIDAISAAKLFYSWPLICKGQLWRLVTNFFYFGSMDLYFLFHMYFLVRYSRLLEEGEFRGRTGDFLWFLLFCASIMTVSAPFVEISFLGRPLAFMMVYVWGRRNEHVRMNMLGMFPFTAPYLAWVLLGFNVVMHSPLNADLLGIAVGHVYYFLEFVYPEIAQIRGWKVKQLMRAPKAIQQLCGQIPADRRRDVPDVFPAPDNGVDGGGHLHVD